MVIHRYLDFINEDKSIPNEVEIKPLFIDLLDELELHNSELLIFFNKDYDKYPGFPEGVVSVDIIASMEDLFPNWAYVSVEDLIYRKIMAKEPIVDEISDRMIDLGYCFVAMSVFEEDDSLHILFDYRIGKPHPADRGLNHLHGLTARGAR